MPAVCIALVALGLVWALALPSATADSPSTPGDTYAGCRLPWPDGSDTDTVQLVYNSQADEFVAVAMKYKYWYDEPGRIDGTGWEWQQPVGFRLSSLGVAISEPALLAQPSEWGGQGFFMTGLPDVVYNPAHNIYLAVYGDAVSIGYGPDFRVVRSSIEARAFGADLTLGGEFVLNAADGYWPTLAHNGDDDEFLVAWYDAAGFPAQFPPPIGTATPTPLPTPIPTGVPTPEPSPLVKGIYAQRLRGDGAPVEGVSLLPLAALDLAPQDVRGLRLAYNRHAHEYLLVWAQGGPYPGLYSRRLSRAGAPLGDSVRLTTPSATPYYPMLAYNDTDHQYLLIWSDADGGTARYSDVLGLVLTEQGTAQGTAFAIRATEKYERPTGVVYNPAQHEYLVAWDTYQGHLRSSDTDVKATLQRLFPTGSPIGEPLQTAGGVFGLAAHPTQGNYIALERFGFQAKHWADEPVCVPTITPTHTPTPTGTRLIVYTPTPTPFVLQEEGMLQEVFPTTNLVTAWTMYQWDGQRWQPIQTMIKRTSQSRVDERFGKAELGAEIWMTSLHITDDNIPTGVGAPAWMVGPVVDHLVQHGVVLGPAETATPTPTGTPNAVATPTPTATATPTPTATATGSAPRASLFLPHLAVNQAR